MKKSAFLLVAIIISFFSCKNEKAVDYIILSGQIENPFSDTLKILDEQQKVVESISLNEDHTFRDTLKLKKGIYNLSDGNESTKIFLKPKFDLTLSLNTKEFDESIVYSGAGSSANNYLAKKYLSEETYGKLRYYGYYAKLSEQDFLAMTDSLYEVESNILNSFPEMDKAFAFVQQKTIEFNKLNKYSSFEGMKRFVTGDKDFKVSDNFPDAFAKVDLSNEQLLESPNYIYFIQDYLGEQTSENFNEEDKSLDYNYEYLKTVIKLVDNATIKEALAYHMGKYNLNRIKKLDSVYYDIMPLISHEEHKKEVTENYKKLKKIEKGAISPSFEFNDINGQAVTLNDLKGKLVYIDIWSTWCMPCVKEIPSLKKMEEQFHGKDIHFVSICKNSAEERWRAMVEDKALAGIQLYVGEDDKSSFFSDYSVQGVPRFILIDKEGKIIDGNAKRPSNPNLNEQIEQYL